MKRLVMELLVGDGWELMATFGEARLMRNCRGQTELRGGSADDRTAAKEWISLFMHDAVPRPAPLTLVNRAR